MRKSFESCYLAHVHLPRGGPARCQRAIRPSSFTILVEVLTNNRAAPTQFSQPKKDK